MRKLTLLIVSLLCYVGVLHAQTLVDDGVYTLSADVNKQRGEMVAANGYDYPVLDGIDLGGYTGNSTAAQTNGQYWYVQSVDASRNTYYIYNIAKGKYLVNEGGNVNFGDNPYVWTFVTNTNKPDYLNIKDANKTGDKVWLSSGCSRTAAQRPVQWDNNNNDGGALYTFTYIGNYYATPETGKFYKIKGDGKLPWLTANATSGGNVVVSGDEAYAGVFFKTAGGIQAVATGKYLGYAGGKYTYSETQLNIELRNTGDHIANYYNKYAVVSGNNYMFNNNTDGIVHESSGVTAANERLWAFIEVEAPAATVNGVLYETLQDAADVVEAGQTLTLWKNSNETIVLPMGVILKRNGFTADDVTVAQPVAQVGETLCATLAAAVNAAQAAVAETNKMQTITLLANYNGDAIELPIGVNLNANGFNANNKVTVKQLTYKYSFVYNGTVKATQEGTVALGAAFPAVNAENKPFGVELTGVPARNVALSDFNDEGKVIMDITVTISGLPFVAAADNASIENWYYIKMHSYDASNTYNKFIQSVSNTEVKWADNSVAAEKQDACTWAFIGNPYDGFKVVNYATGTAIAENGGAPVLNEAGVQWIVTASSHKQDALHFCLKYPNGETKYLNADAKTGALGFWTDPDAGSTMWVTSRDINNEVTELTTLVNQANDLVKDWSGKVGDLTEESKDAVAAAISAANTAIDTKKNLAAAKQGLEAATGNLQYIEGPSFDGEGTADSPYIINNVEMLVALRDAVNGGEAFEGKYFKLTSDITLSGEWTAIGKGSRSSKSYTGNAFKGVFDGGNNTISGLTITSTTAADAAIGLFGVVDGGTVKNLNLTNVDINVPTSNLAGAAIGMMLNGATAEGITVNGAIVGNDGVGGIAGRLVIDGTITNCTNNASVTSSYGGIGGIVGKAYYEDGADTATFASITNCTNKGTITAPMYVGGIAGFARANVSDCVNEGAIVGGTQTGGIVGQLMAAGTVSGNENKAKVSGTNHVGGIIGDYSQSGSYTYNNVSIVNNINRGELSAQQCAAILGCNNIDGFTAMTAAGNVSYYHVEGLVLFGNPEDMVIDATNKFIVPVAQVGAETYYTLADAVAAAAQSGDEIVIIANVELTETTEFPAGKTITLNLNNKKVSAVDKNVIKNNGAALTIKNGTIERTGTVAGYAVNVVSGTLEVEGVTIVGGLYTSGTSLVATNTNISQASASRHAIYAYNCAVTINSGTYHNDNAGNATIFAYGSSVITIEDGTFSIDNGKQTLGWTSCMLDANAGGKFVINGGTFKGHFRVQANSTMEINGGTFENTHAEAYAIYGTTVVKGGTFTDDAAKNFAKNNIADDYKVGEDGKVVYAPVVAKIGDTKYETLEAAFAAATEGQTITLLNDATPALASQRAITKAAVIDLGGKTMTLTEDDLYFGTTTFKNGTIVVDPSVKPSTAVFWMFANQTLTFDAVKVVATGVTGTYLIGLDGNNSDLNLLNGSEILVENTTALDLDIICVNASTGNDIKVENSKVNVTNLDGRVFFRGNYTVAGNSEINLEGITKAGFRIEAGQTLTIKDNAVVNIVGEPRDGGIHMTDLTATYTKAETATVNATLNRPAVAKIGDTPYYSLAEAAAAAQSGDEIVMLADVTLAEALTLPAGITFNGNGKQITGTLVAAGDITFAGVTKAGDLDFAVGNTVVNIPAGASLQLNGSARMSIGFGTTFNIVGNIEDAKTADKATVVPSLVIPGASFSGAGVKFNVTNAYISVPSSYCSTSKTASGTFDFNITNSIWESAGKLAFEEQSVNAKVDFALVNSVLTTGSHLVFGTASGEEGVVIDNSYVNKDTSRQLENCGTMTIKNGSVVNGAVATSSNAKNPGTVIVENATYAVTGEFSGSDLGTGTIIIKKDANVSVGSIKAGANVTVDATGMTAGDVVNFTANLSQFTGTLSVINNDKLEAKIVDGKIVLAAKPVAKIGEQGYATLEAAFKAATDGCTIEILSDVTVDYNWDARYTGGKFTVPVTINGNSKTIKFTASVNDNNYQAAFRFEADATVKNLTVDMSETTDSRFRAISSKGNLTVDGCTFIGKDETLNCRAIIFGEGAGANVGNLAIAITNSEFINWKRGITDNENAQDVKTVTITGNTLTDAGVGVSAKETVTFTGNTVAGAYVNIKSYTAGNKLAVTATGNTLETNTDAAYNVIDAGGVVNAEGFNIVAKGNNFNGYTSTDGIWGEVWGNARESFVIKVLDANSNVMGTTSLNNVGGIIDGDVTVSWNLKFDAASNTDEYWTMAWTTAPSINNMPAKVELWVDGVKVSGGPVVLNGPDDLNKIVAAATDADGKILSCHTSLAAAVAANAKNIALLRNADDEAIMLPSDVTLNYNGFTANKLTMPEARVNNVDYAKLADAMAAAKAGDVVTVFAGTYTMPSMKAGITIVGQGDVMFEGTLTGTLENLTMKNIHIKGGNAQRWAYAKGNLVFDNVTFEATSVYALHFDGITEGTNLTYKNCTIIGWAALGGSPASCVFDGCTFKGNGTYGVIRTYFDTEIKNSTFDVANVKTDDAYQDGIHAVEGANVTVTECTNANNNGDMKAIVNVGGSSVITVDGKAYKNVAQIGETKYITIEDAIEAWTNNTTLTLLADVTLSDVIQLSSTEYHVLDLGTYTMTAASKKDAIQIVNNGRSSASYALDIKANAENPGGITATGKAVVKTTGKSGVKDRPIIRFYNGVFNASNIIQHSGSNGTNSPQFVFYNGVYNGNISTNRAICIFEGGTFNGRFYMSVDSSSYARIGGGTFMYMDNLYGSALNSDKFTIGSAKGVFDRGVYVDDNGCVVIGGAVVTEAGDKFEASSTNVKGAGSYLDFSSAKNNGLYYTAVEEALADNNTTSGKVTVYADEIDMTGITYKGTIIVPVGETVTITNAPENLKVQSADGYVITPNANNEYVSIALVAKIGDKVYDKFEDAVAAAQEGDTVTVHKTGTYALKVKNNVTITGAVADVEFANIGAFGCNGANVTFNNVTFTYAENSTYKGLQHSGNLVYNNCTFNGQVFLYGQSETFNECTFNTTDSNNYNVWTYGAKNVAFNKCTFNSAGKSVLIYSEQASNTNNVTVTESQFIATQAVEGKAAIEMDSSLSGAISLTIDGETTASGFAAGNVSGNSLWNNKKGNNDVANNDITVKVGDTVVLAPIFEAQIGDAQYRFFQDAINAVQNDETITVLRDIATNVEIKEKDNVKVTIDGNGMKMTGTIKVVALSSDNDRRITIKNFKFEDTTSASVDFITSVETNHYPRITVEGCTFTGSGDATDVALRLKSSKNVEIKNCTGKGLHSFLQNTSGWNLTIEGVTVTESKSAFALGTVQGVTVKGCTADVDGYGIRLDANTYNNNAVIADNNIKAFIPVVVRKANTESNVTVQGTNTMTATNTDGLWMAVGTSEYETNGELPTAATGQVKVALTDTGLDAAGIYGSYYDSLTIHVGATQKSRMVVTRDIYVATMDEAVAEAKAIGAGAVIYKVYGEAELTTGGSHGILDLGENVVIEGADATAKLTIVGGGVPDIKGVTFRNITLADEGTYLTTANEFMYQNYIDCTFENVTFVDGIRLSGTSSIKDSKVDANTTNEYAIWLDEGEFTMTGTTVVGGADAYGLVKSDKVSKITITDNTFQYLGEANKEALNVKEAVIIAQNNQFIDCVKGILPADKTNYTDEGTVATDEIIAGNNTVTVYYAAVGEQKFETLLEAINAVQQGETIELIRDIEATSVILIDKSVTINGNGHKVTSNANRVFRVTAAAEVTLNNVNMVSTAFSSYTNDIRGISLDGGVQGVIKLTLNNCSVDFDPESGSDWAYAVNISGNASGYTLAINGGTYEGANVINIWGNNHKITIDGATLNNLYNAPQNNYYGQCVRFEGTGCETTIKNSVFNGVHAVVVGEKTPDANTVAQENNTDNTKTYNVKVGTKYYYTLAEAFAAVEDNATIEVRRDIEETEAVVNTKNVVLDLKGKTVTYTSAVAGEDMITNRGNLTITDSSDAKTGKLAYVNTDATASNVTVSTISTEAGSTLVVDGGTIENKTVKADGSSIYSYAIDILTNGNLGDVNVTINGGTVYSDYMAIRQFNNGTACKNSLTINGGYIYGAKRAVQVHMDNNAAVTAIKGGKVEAGAEGYALCNFAAAGNLEVTGGEFIGAVYSARENFISGGIYDAEVYAGYCADGYMPNKNVDGTYGVVLVANAYASIDGVTYGSLKAAVKAAKAGETITLLKNVKENVTISKNLTIDGAGKTITGMITTDGKSLKVTIKNVNFDGDNGTIGYAMRADDDLNLVVENCTASNYLYGFLYANKSNDKIVVKNVTVENCAEYGAYLVAFNNATFENFTVKGNTKYGIAVANAGARTVNLKNVTFEGAEQPLHINEIGTGKVTFKFSGSNEMSKAEFYTSQYVKVVAAAQVGTKVCGSLQDAVVAANDGETVKVLADVNMTTANFVTQVDGYATLVNVAGKAVTIDLNGKKVTVNAADADLNGKAKVNMLMSVFHADPNGTLTLTDSSAEGTGTVELIANDAKVYGLIVSENAYDKSNPGKIIVNGGNYIADKLADSMIFADINEVITVNGGNFHLGNVGTGENGSPWIFNASGQNQIHINVNGGTYNANIAKQFYSYEVNLGEGLTTTNNGDGTWTVVPAVASIVGGESYGSIQEAIDAAQDGETVKLIADVVYTDADVQSVEEKPYTTMLYVQGKNITLDLNGKNIDVTYTGSLLYSVVLVSDGAGLTVTGEGSINAVGLKADGTAAKNIAYVFWKRGETGYLTIENGTFHMNDAADSMVYTNGDEIVTINGGTFILDAVASQDNGFPVIFSTQGNNERQIVVNAGTFNYDINHQIRPFEPYVAPEKAVKKVGDMWTIVPAQAYVTEMLGEWVTEPGDNEHKVGYATVAEAIAATSNLGKTVTILAGEYTMDIAVNKAGVTVQGETDENGNNLVNITGCVAASTGTTVKNLNVKNEKTGKYDCALSLNRAKDVTIDGVNLSGYNAIAMGYADGNITIKNSVIEGANYAVHFDGNAGGVIAFENSKITGWCAYASTIESVTYTNCTLNNGTKYSGQRFYNKNVAFNECTFGDGFKIELAGKKQNVAFTDADMTMDDVKALMNKDSYITSHTVTLNGTQVTYAVSAQGKLYSTLQAAIDDLPVGGTATYWLNLKSDNVLTEGVVVPAGVKATINLNGFNIIGTPAEAKAYAVITNYGTLTIEGKDSVICNHTLAGSTGYAVNTITNCGTLTIDGATIVNKSTAQYQIGYAIDNNSTSTDAEVTVKGGKVTASGSLYYDGIRQFCNSTTRENDVYVEGGEVSTIWMQNPSDGADKNTKDVNGYVGISGGKVGVLSLEPSANFQAAITDGHVGEVSYFQTADGRDLKEFVTGGTFGTPISENFLAWGYQLEGDAAPYKVEWTGRREEVTFIDGEFTEYTNEKEIEVGTLTYKRTISAAWQAFYVPFQVPVDSLAKLGFEVAYINGVRRSDYNEDGEFDSGFSMELIMIHGGKGNANGSGKTLKANYPYFIRPVGTESKELTIVLNDALLYAAEDVTYDCSTFAEKFEITGNSSQVVVNSTDDEFRYVVTSKGEWSKRTTPGNVKPFRFYMTVTSRDGSAPLVAEASMSIVVRGEELPDGTTVIYDVYDENTEDMIFDLQGRRVLETEKGGIYIKGGKKFIAQ